MLILLDSLTRKYPDRTRLRKLIDRRGALEGAKSIRLQDQALEISIIICHAVHQLRETVQGADWWALYVPGEKEFVKPRVILEKIP